MDKGRLDELIEKHKAQPVGDGYIDIIVSRENYKPFIADLINENYRIDSISWWEWCPDGKENRYGLGGPVSKFYNGWFSELSIETDDIEIRKDEKQENIIKQLTDRIETKSIGFPNETVTFKLNDWLTPALWIDVPNDWRNKYCA